MVAILKGSVDALSARGEADSRPLVKRLARAVFDDR
jgi:hypothetical protein